TSLPSGPCVGICAITPHPTSPTSKENTKDARGLRTCRPCHSPRLPAWACAWRTTTRGKATSASAGAGRAAPQNSKPARFTNIAVAGCYASATAFYFYTAFFALFVAGLRSPHPRCVGAQHFVGYFVPFCCYFAAL